MARFTAHNTDHQYNNSELAELNSAFDAIYEACPLSSDSKSWQDHLAAHTLRHTATSWLVQAGVDLMVAGGYIGHRDPATTKRYAHHAPNYQDKAVAAPERRRVG